MTERKLLTVRGAADPARRTPRTIENWIQAGMKTIPIPSATGVRAVKHYIDEEVLLAWFRDTLTRTSRPTSEE